METSFKGRNQSQTNHLDFIMDFGQTHNVRDVFGI